MIKKEPTAYMALSRKLKNSLKIHFEDPHLIVLSKPAGLLSQGEITGDENLVDLMREYLGRPYVGLVHRLDRQTSGLMVIAKRTKSAQRLTQSLQDGKMVRTYRAWLVGKLENEARWVHQLLKDSKSNTVRVVPRGGQSGGQNGGQSGKEASLHAKPVGYGFWRQTQVTLAEFILETGRSHQIRVQAAASGHPVLGDSKYGSLSQNLSFPRTALHSWRLVFPHPMSSELLSYEEPIPQDMQKISPIPF